MKKILIILSLMLSVSSASAGMSSRVEIEGTVESFDREKVLVKTESGRGYIPRTNVRPEDLRPGRKIRVHVNMAQIMKLNQKYRVAAKNR